MNRDKNHEEVFQALQDARTWIRRDGIDHVDVRLEASEDLNWSLYAGSVALVPCLRPYQALGTVSTDSVDGDLEALARELVDTVLNRCL